MNASKKLILIFSILGIISCKKDPSMPLHDSSTTVISENYSSINDFFSKNSVAMQTYNIDGSLGGSFISPQGTTVSVPANAFITQTGSPVTGNVTIQFKDIYAKSDMLLSDMPTTTYWGIPLKSGGEFFIKATSNNSAIILASGKKINVIQPAALTGGLDTLNQQQAFNANDTIPRNWIQNYNDSVHTTAEDYIFSLYQFNSPADSGSWCNSDNASYFSKYTQTILKLIPNDNVNVYYTQVFLVFKKISSMVHVYYDYTSSFPYNYAPVGLQCTIVAVGVKNGTLYSSFVPITISANQTINFTLSATTTSAFISQLKALN